MNIEEIKNLKFHSNDLNKEITIREYLVKLLGTLWEEDEGFSGKRPLGNSGWQGDIEMVLVECGVIEGTIDEDGYVGECDGAKFDIIMQEVIKSLK